MLRPYKPLQMPRIFRVIRPADRVFEHVPANPVQGVFVPYDMFVVVALPNRAVRGANGIDPFGHGRFGKAGRIVMQERHVTGVESDAQTAETLLQKARALAPILRERAAATGEARCIPHETIQDFWDAGLWYTMKPKKFGGPEIRPDVALAAASELARGDGSAAWIWAVMSIHDLLVALWPEEFQQEYWAKPTLSPSSFAPTGAAKPAGGGFRVSGKWSFCSGIDHADWVLLGTFFGPPSGGSPMPDLRYVMVPKSDCKAIDDWFVFGLRGTGSKGLVVEDVFVPNHRICALADMMQGTSPGSRVHDSPLYKASIWSIIPFTISSPANGMAQGALDAFVDEMKVREGSFDHSPLAKKPGMQLAVAEASAMIDSAGLLYWRSFHETIDKIFAGEPITIEHRVRNRRDQAIR
jgi:3-hydroxy-9,10-secoandrosta-1,3,5(10)-triene-9,17-dione monooxygenase